MDERVNEEAGEPVSAGTASRPAPQWWVVVLVVASGAAALFYEILMHGAFGHTAAMFIGVPLILSVILALTPKAKTVTGGIIKGITPALLIAAPLVGEGYLCILMASPLFYVVGLAVGLIIDGFRGRRSTTLSCVTLLLLPMCFEGVVPQLTWNRAQSVTVTETVDATADGVAAALGESPRVGVRLPAFLRIGFPQPLEAYGEGLGAGAKRTIHFAGAEGNPPGDLVMRVAESEPGRVRFETVSDASKLTQWVRWSGSDVSWEPVDGGHTRVTWTVRFERQLDPAWYFTPMERAAVHEAAKFLIAANATPAGAKAEGRQP